MGVSRSLPEMIRTRGGSLKETCSSRLATSPVPSCSTKVPGGAGWRRFTPTSTVSPSTSVGIMRSPCTADARILGGRRPADAVGASGGATARAVAVRGYRRQRPGSWSVRRPTSGPEDARLTLIEQGLLAYLTTFPDPWQFGVMRFAPDQAAGDVPAVEAALRRLEACDQFRRTKIADPVTGRSRLLPPRSAAM